MKLIPTKSPKQSGNKLKETHDFFACSAFREKAQSFSNSPFTLSTDVEDDVLEISQQDIEREDGVVRSPGASPCSATNDEAQ